MKIFLKKNFQKRKITKKFQMTKIEVEVEVKVKVKKRKIIKFQKRNNNSH